jgi:hypothetical protein
MPQVVAFIFQQRQLFMYSSVSTRNTFGSGSFCGERQSFQLMFLKLDRLVARLARPYQKPQGLEEFKIRAEDSQERFPHYPGTDPVMPGTEQAVPT